MISMLGRKTVDITIGDADFPAYERLAGMDTLIFNVAALVAAFLLGIIFSERVSKVGYFMQDQISKLIHTHVRDTSKYKRKGSIQLVGAGPGDPNLLTVGALNAVLEADVVLADTLCPHEILALVRGELKVAKKYPGNAAKAQAELNQWGLEALSKGKCVVRLKGGDPFLFGRGGEEVLHYRQYGYECKVIPGISSSLAAPLLGGIPTTHRGVATQLLISTGVGKDSTTTPIPKHEPYRTSVFLMSVGRSKTLTSELLQAGYPPQTPAAFVEKASMPEQRTTYTTVARLTSTAAEEHIRSPAVIVVGAVADVLKPASDAASGNDLLENMSCRRIDNFDRIKNHRTIQSQASGVKDPSVRVCIA